MLRISSGQWRGRKILAPEGDLKPTSDKVRQALFNTLRPRIYGAHVLDLFAGSGSVGITALSEGASFAAFVENEPRTHRALRQNLLDLSIPKEAYIIHKADARKISGLFTQKFDIIFADPFYPEINISFVKNLHTQALSLLEAESIFILEHASRLHTEDLQALEGFDHTKKYGDTSLSIFLT